jgi:hypothetical protein
MTEPGAERTVVDCTADLEQQIGAPSRPSHLLGFVHAAVNQEVRRAFGDRRSDPLTGTVSFGIVDQPCGLALEIFIERMQCVPQLARCHAFRTLAVLPSEDMHDLADPANAALGILRLAVPNALVQTFDFGDDHRLRHHPVSVVGRQIGRRQLRVLQTHRDMKPIQNR